MTQVFCAVMESRVICMDCSYKIDKMIEPIQSLENVAIAYPDGFTCDECNTVITK